MLPEDRRGRSGHLLGQRKTHQKDDLHLRSLGSDGISDEVRSEHEELRLRRVVGKGQGTLDVSFDRVRLEMDAPLDSLGRG